MSEIRPAASPSEVDPSEMIEYRGLKLRRDPAREDCFRVVHQHYEVYMPTAENPVEATGHENLHSLWNSEVLSLEIAAQTICDFPDAPWELRLHLARICWDETRHADMVFGRLLELGGHKGEFPIINHEWNVVCRFSSLEARLAVQNRSFEAGSVDLFHQLVDFWQDRGDPRTAEIVETIMTDEVDHARFGNYWIQQLAKGNPRATIRMVEAMSFVKRAVQVLSVQPGEVIVDGQDLSGVTHDVPVQEQARSDAGFTNREIAELRRRDAMLPSAGRPREVH
jgi:uncharacterized ferritin-like protein (DUF455 family)